MELIALCGRPYAGKSFLVRRLVEHGYQALLFGDLLKSMAAEIISTYRGTDVTVSDIVKNKAFYRDFLRELGNVIEFSTDPSYVEEMLKSWSGGPAVFDCIRAESQFQVLAPYGFRLVRVVADEKTRRERALAAGCSEEEFTRLESIPLEQGLEHSDLVDYQINTMEADIGQLIRRDS